MIRERQAEFVSELIKNVKANLLNNVERIPEEWDGIELRQWVADTFDRQTGAPKHFVRRLREYKNEVLARKLL